MKKGHSKECPFFIYNLLANCPQAASISWPLDFLIVTLILFFSSLLTYSLITLSDACIKSESSIELY